MSDEYSERFRAAGIAAETIAKWQRLLDSVRASRDPWFYTILAFMTPGMILGAHLFCAESQEMINLVRLVMAAGIPYTVLRDSIYTHPTMSEALNDLFGALKA